MNPIERMCWRGEWRAPVIFGFRPSNKGIAVDHENNALLLFRIKPRAGVELGDRWEPTDIMSYIGAIQFTSPESIDVFIRALEMLKEGTNGENA